MRLCEFFLRSGNADAVEAALHSGERPEGCRRKLCRHRKGMP